MNTETTETTETVDITPRPTFFLVTGLPGSGKTTFVNRVRHEYGKPHVYVNRDTIRGLLGYESPADPLADEGALTSPHG